MNGIQMEILAFELNGPFPLKNQWIKLLSIRKHRRFLNNYFRRYSFNTGIQVYHIHKWPDFPVNGEKKTARNTGTLDK